MTNADITRFLVQPRKHYAGARMQQGRVVLDSDFNEGAELVDEERRRALLEIVGPSGSPDEGFAADLDIGDEVTIQPVSFNGEPPIDTLNYRIRPGTMYVAGLRFEHEERTIDDETSGDPIVFQRDFLQMQAADAPQPQPGATHSQLTYLHGWQQTVTATEDQEIRERALGGIDTSVRVRRMARVQVREVENDDCTAAWEAVRTEIEAEVGGAFDETGHELLSPARLRVTFVPGEALDPCASCTPDDVGRYLGANNQTIRIMLVNSDSYAWAFDNASPLYRVELGEAEDGLVPVRMIAEPRDEARWPLENTVVEFLPWAVLLDNNEKVAAETGVFVRVAEGFDPDESSFQIAEADLAQIEALVREWDAAHPDFPWLPNNADPDGNYLYLRTWHRLDSENDDVLLDTAAGPANHALLRRQGLLPEFTGGGRPGDYWVVTVRPNTPQVIVPWSLTQDGGVAPHGPRHVYAPLSLITFRPPEPGEHENTEVVESIHDCRSRFRPLVDRGGCCTHTVGDGVGSRGDYLSIQAAIDGLPAAGGKVCVLPGTYTEEVRIERSDVIIEGCGHQTLLRTPTGATSPALIHVLAPRVTLRELSFETLGQIGILAGEEDLNADPAATDLVLERLTVVADERAGVGGQTRTAIDVRRGLRAEVRECEVTMRGSVSDEAGMFVRGEDIRVERCRIETAPAGETFAAWGGIQIGGASRRVQIRRNRITGGLGHGITLGSLEWIAETTTTTTNFGAGAGLQNTFDPCAPLEEEVQPVEVENVRFDPETAGDLDEVLISDNQIQSMQGNGISVLTTLPLQDDGDQDLITVDRITIERNRISNCVVQSRTLASSSPVQKTKKLQPGEEEVFGQFLVSSIPPAAIALVDGEHIVIRDNEIRDNGTTDPAPIAGICIIFGNDIVIEGNRIQNNGLRQPASIPSISSMRAGVAISLAGVASNQETQDQSDTLGSSLRVIGNTVEHPNGPALAARATGPVAIEDNYLLSLGNNATAQQASTAHTVAVVNAGMPWESIDLATGEPSPNRWIFPPRTPEYLRRQPGGDQGGGVGAPGEGGGIIGQGGPVMFKNNHVTLRWVETANAAAGLASGFSVGICSLDDVVMFGNQFALNVEDPGLKKKSGTTFNRQPRISAQVVAVGATANASHNRVAEGVNDALISLLVLGGFLVTASYNITTHMSFSATCHGLERDPTGEGGGGPANANDQYRVHRGNLVWLRPALQSSNQDLVSIDTVNAVAQQLFVTLCDTCLGLGPPGGGIVFPPILGVITP
ncbi:MAG: right-handed parallel beta-helix repeat-containing protein [Bryobacteraceae bacterium]